VKKFAIEALQALILLATIVGLFLAAAAIDRPELGVVVVVLSIGWAILRLGAPRALHTAGDWVTRVRNYPRLLQRAAASDIALAEAERQVAEFREQSRTIFREGVHEGHMQVYGAIFSGGKDGPDLLAVSLDNDIVVLVGRSPRDSHPRLGARYSLEVPGTGRLVGVLQVEHVDTNTGHLRMSCVDRTDEAFWVALEGRAATDPSPPGGVRLVPTQIPIPDLVRKYFVSRKETE
jgi:hypothetical protein